MENLNAEQVKSDLAICVLGDCQACHYNKFIAGCRDELCGDALALITSQEQRIKELAEELDDAKRDTIPKLRCSLERANAMGVEADKTIEKLTEENERLKKRCVAKIVIDEDKLGEIKADILERVELDIKAIEADTARKMQERLKEKAYTNNYCQDVVLAKDIDQIAKEIIEDVCGTTS